MDNRDLIFVKKLILILFVTLNALITLTPVTGVMYLIKEAPVKETGE